MVFILFPMLLSCLAILNYNNLIILLVNQHIYIIYTLLFSLFYLNFTYLARYQHVFMLSFINFFWFTLLNCFFCVNLFILSNYIDIFVIFFIFAVLRKLNFIIIDFKALFFDFYFYFSGFLGFVTKPNLFLNKFKLLFTQVNDRRKYILKKYVYTINHKRIAINYFIFSM